MKNRNAAKGAALWQINVQDAAAHIDHLNKRIEELEQEKEQLKRGMGSRTGFEYLAEADRKMAAQEALLGECREAGSKYVIILDMLTRMAKITNSDTLDYKIELGHDSLNRLRNNLVGMKALLNKLKERG